jgi:glycosyltransferase involved in cell wall biosynthesis
MSRKKWSHCENANDLNVGFINLRGLKHISQYFSYIKNGAAWIKKNKDEKNIILAYGGYFPFAAALPFLKKLYPNIHISLIVPDIPTHDNDRKNLLYKILYIEEKFSLYLMKKFDSYIFLTKHMASLLDAENKPYVVIEGIASTVNRPYEKDDISEKKIVLYSGRLAEKYNIRTLIEAFKGIRDSSYELWLCGHGDMVDEIISEEKSDSRIKYLGFLDEDAVLYRQHKATVLINPRRNTSALEKYSFPSKTMEYLKAGKPVIAYKLEGIPEEYENYIEYVDDNTTDALKQKIIEICELADDKRAVIGQRNYNFVLSEKNEYTQTLKIFNMFKIV